MFALPLRTACGLTGTASLLLLTTCATNPVTGRHELALISESQEIAMGQDGAKSVTQGVGVVQDAALQNYVSTLGLRIAHASERPSLPWSYTVIDDAAVNAFALPGGPVFITRGILAHMTSEAELVSVLGHETGHITARHVVQQVSRQQLAQIGLVAAVIVKPELGQLADVASQGMGLLFLKFSRDHETQADALGFRYMVAEHYDPNEMAAMFHMLEQLTAASGGRVPQWQSTHPDPGNRFQTTRDRIAASPPVGAQKVERDAFVSRLDGLVFGDDPRQGFFRGTSFLHPDLKFQLDFPNGWQTHNEAGQVSGVSAQQDAVVALTLAGKSAPSQALSQFLGQQGMTNRGASAAAINGLPAATAAFSVATQNGSLGGWVAFVDLDGTTLRLLGYTTADRLSAYDGTLRNSVTSLRRLSDPGALAVKPARVRLTRINSAMTVAAFNQAYPSTIPLAQLALINGVESAGTIPAGTLVKRVVVDR